MSNHYDDHKLVLSSDEDDEDWNPLSLACSDCYMRAAMYSKITQRAECYAYRFNPFNPDAWFGDRADYLFDADLHERLGLALGTIDLNRPYDFDTERYCDAQFNKLLTRLDNVLSNELQRRAVVGRRRNASDLLRKGFSAEKICEVIKHVLETTFGACYPEVMDINSVDQALSNDDRNDIANIAQTCFTIAGDDTNVCWVVDGYYDCYLGHLFRTVLFHELSFLKQYTNKQKYFVSENLLMSTETSLKGAKYRRVNLVFAIDSHSKNRADSSDEDCGDEDEGEVEDVQDRAGNEDEGEVEDAQDRAGNEDLNAGEGFFDLRSFGSMDEEDEIEIARVCRLHAPPRAPEQVEVKAPTAREAIMNFTCRSDGAIEYHEVDRLEDGSRITTAFRVAQLSRLYWLVGDLILSEQQAERDLIRMRAMDDAEEVE